jgi:GntR family transcriptional repressor for pyruvate dehydrogenase complex
MASTAIVPIEPPSRSTLAQDVANQLITLVLGGHLLPGDRLPSQQELTEQLQVGRSTVREALRTLNAIGLVEFKQGHGTFIKQLDVQALIRPELLAYVIDRKRTEQLFEARQTIEPEIARLAALRATESDLTAIEQAWVACRNALQAGQTLHQLSPNFHRAIAEAAHSEVLAMFVDSILIPLAERGLLLQGKPGYLEWELDSHRGVYEAIASREPELAQSVMARHLADSHAALLEMLA